MVLVYAELDANGADCLGNEPTYDGDRIMGITTSGAYAHSVGKSILFAYVDPQFEDPGLDLRGGHHERTPQSHRADRARVGSQERTAEGVAVSGERRRAGGRAARVAARAAGGRTARVAARAAGPTEDEKAVHPGQRGGAYRPLTESKMERVYDAALDLIERHRHGHTGARVHRGRNQRRRAL